MIIGNRFEVSWVTRLVGWRRAPGPGLWVSALAVALILPTAAIALAQPAEQAPADRADVEADREEAPSVLLSGEPVIGIMTGVGPFSAQQRADRISVRLETILHDRSIADPRVTLSDADDLTQLKVGSHLVMSVTEVDAKAVGVARRQVAAAYAAEIEGALRAERARRTPEALLTSALKAVAATVVLVLGLWGLSRVWRWINGRIHAWRMRRLESVQIKGVEFMSAGRVSRVLASVQRATLAVLILVVLDLYLTYVLALFPWTRTTSIALLGYVIAPFRAGWDALVGYLPNLFFVLFIALVTYYAIRFVGLFFAAIALGRITFERFPADWAHPTNLIVRVLLIAFAMVIAFPYLPGSSSPAFAGISVLAGVLLSLASSSSLSNMIAGLVLTYTGAFRLGERVQIGDTTGDIVDRSLLATRIRTIKNEEVTIPNSIVLGTQVVNYSREAHRLGLILHTSVTIGYDAPWRKIHGLLTEAALKTRGLLATPAPFVWQTALNDFYVTYEINAYTNLAQQMSDIYAELHANIQDAFYAAGVEIMSPHFAAVRDGNAMAVPRDKWPAGYEPARFRLESRGAPGEPREDDIPSGGVTRS